MPSKGGGLCGPAPPVGRRPSPSEEAVLVFEGWPFTPVWDSSDEDSEGRGVERPTGGALNAYGWGAQRPEVTASGAFNAHGWGGERPP